MSNSSETRCGHIPPLRGWWIHSARFPSRFCCYSFWGGLFYRVHFDCLLLLLLLASFVSVSSSPPGLDFSFKSAHRQTVRVRPLSYWPELPTTLATSMVSRDIYLFFLKERKREKSAVSGVFCAVRYSSPFPGKLLRRVLLLFPKRNTVNGHRTAPQANFSPLFSAWGRDGGRGLGWGNRWDAPSAGL